MTIQPPEQPAAGNGLLDGVQQAPAFDMDAYIRDVGETPKQDYEPQWQRPEGEEPPPQPSEADRYEQETREGVRAQAQARKAAANAIMLMADKGQAGVFTLFGAKGHAADFRFNPEDRKEMAVYLEQMLPENFRMPPWVPFSILFITAMGVNVAKLQEIRAEKKKLAAAETAKANAERNAEEEKMAKARAERAERDHQRELERVARQKELLREREEMAEREAELRAQMEPPPPPPKPDAPELCAECKVKPARAGDLFCSKRCEGKHLKRINTSEE